MMTQSTTFQLFGDNIYIYIIPFNHHSFWQVISIRVLAESWQIIALGSIGEGDGEKNNKYNKNILNTDHNLSFLF